CVHDCFQEMFLYRPEGNYDYANVVKLDPEQSKIECKNDQWHTEDTVIAATIGSTFLLIMIGSCVFYCWAKRRANRPDPVATTPTEQKSK
ncbi:hypothetical protein PMAYCL1PPCAC_21328, partial [Pristionchus mayeri]